MKQIIIQSTQGKMRNKKASHCGMILNPQYRRLSGKVPLGIAQLNEKFVRRLNKKKTAKSKYEQSREQWKQNAS